MKLIPLWLRPAFVVWRKRALALPVSVALALNLAGLATVLAISDALLGKPLNVSRPGELVEICRSDDKRQVCAYLSYPEFTDFQNQTDVFNGVVGYTMLRGVVRAGNVTEALFGELVTSTYFDVLGLRPALGSFFVSGNDRADVGHVVISYSFWQRAFGGRADAIGAPVFVNGRPRSVIGVAPAHFRGLYLQGIYAKQAWLPLSSSEAVTGEEVAFDDRATGIFAMVGRLAFTSTELRQSAFFDQFRAVNSEVYAERQFFVRPLSQEAIYGGRQFTGVIKARSTIAVVIVGATLLVTCLNLSMLLAAGVQQRMQEFDVRAALGASTSDLVRHVFVEIGSLGTAGVAVALLLAAVVLPIVGANPPPTLGIAGLSVDPTLSIRVIRLVLAIAVTSMVLASAWPLAILLGRRKTGGDLSPVREVTPRRLRLRTSIVTATIGASVGLVVLTGGLVAAVSAGVGDVAVTRGDRTVVATFVLGHRPLPAEQVFAVRQGLARELSNLSGVQRVGFIDAAPLTLIPPQRLEVRQDSASTPSPVVARRVTPDVFGALGISPLAGRLFAEAEAFDGHKVAVVSDGLRKQLFNDGPAIGQAFYVARDTTPTEIIGVVPDTAMELSSGKPAPSVFLPLTQTFRSTRLIALLALSSPAAVRGLSPELATVAGRVDPALGVLSVKTLDQSRLEGFYPQRAAMLLVALMSLLTLVIACVGSSGLAIALVQGERKPVAIRLALGATRYQAHRGLLNQVAIAITAGVTLGIVAGYYSLEVVNSVVTGLERPSAWVTAVSAGAVGVGVLLAAYLASRRLFGKEIEHSLRVG